MRGTIARHMQHFCIALLSLSILTFAACDQPTQSNALPDQQQVLRVASWGSGEDI